MRFAFIARHRHIRPVSWLCEGLEVSRSGFHAWLTRPTSPRECYDAKLVTAIEASFKARDQPCGARRIWRDVMEMGLVGGLHRIKHLGLRVLCCGGNSTQVMRTIAAPRARGFLCRDRDR